jgi:transposase
MDASKVAIFLSLRRSTVNRIYHKIRLRVCEICEIESPFLVGEIELDESYFGGRKKGKRGRGAIEKIPVFGILKRGDKVYTQIVKNCTVSELLPIIEGKVNKDSIIYTDSFKTYDCLVDYGYKQHYRIKHSKEFAVGRNHINGIENFWGLCKVRLAKFRGINKKKFYLHLKECEFRYNYKKQNIYLLLLKNIRNKPLL